MHAQHNVWPAYISVPFIISLRIWSSVISFIVFPPHILFDLSLCLSLAMRGFQTNSSRNQTVQITFFLDVFVRYPKQGPLTIVEPDSDKSLVLKILGPSLKTRLVKCGNNSRLCLDFVNCSFHQAFSIFRLNDAYTS